jgi:multidrug resistance efflux pump
MSEVQAKSKPETGGAAGAEPWPPHQRARAMPSQRPRILPVLLTVLVAAVACVLGRAMWTAYMGAPWTRDVTVRTYVVAMAPEVAGRIVELPVRDNQFVHKNELLMAVDPTDYSIAVSQAEAAAQQAQGNVQNIGAQMEVQQAQISANKAPLDRAQAALVFA